MTGWRSRTRCADTGADDGASVPAVGPAGRGRSRRTWWASRSMVATIRCWPHCTRAPESSSRRRSRESCRAGGSEPPTPQMTRPPSVRGSATDGGRDAGEPSGNGPPAGASGGGPSAGSADDPVDACATERRLAAERCGFAVGARGRANEAAEALRVTQRTYDASRRRRRCRRGDRRRAGRPPREGGGAGPVPGGLQRIRSPPRMPRRRPATGSSRSTTSTTPPGPRPSPRSARRAAAASIGAGLEHLTLEMDAARIAAEAAEAACLVARQALAECDERVMAGDRRAVAARPVERATDRRDRRGRAAGRRPDRRRHADDLPPAARRRVGDGRPGREAGRR